MDYFYQGYTGQGLPRYNWNIVEGGVKQHNPPPTEQGSDFITELVQKWQ